MATTQAVEPLWINVTENPRAIQPQENVLMNPSLDLLVMIGIPVPPMIDALQGNVLEQVLLPALQGGDVDLANVMSSAIYQPSIHLFKHTFLAQHNCGGLSE